MDDNGVIEISGTVEPDMLLKMLGKAGNKAELQWLQFGECSTNLFMPTNHSNTIGGQGSKIYPYDGRYLHSGNLPRPMLPSQENNHHQHHQKIAYDHPHHYDQYAHNQNHQYTLNYDGYDQNHDYANAYDYPRSYDHDNYDCQHYDYDQGHVDNQQYVRDYGYNYSQGYDGNKTHYRGGGDDIACCRVM